MQFQRRRNLRNRLRVFQLERRDVPAGTTVITHGLSLSTQFGSDSWVRATGNAIAARSPGPDVILMYDFAANELRFDGGTAVPANFQAGSDEYIVYVNWETASGRTAPGWAESAGEGLYGALRRYGLANNAHPLHFIAHSYGTVVNSETIQRLGFFDGLAVDQMTTLDPHDFFESFSGFIFPNYEADVDMPDVHVWSNVKYADNYYNTNGKSTLFDPLPHGRALDGSLDKAAINVNLSNLTGFNVNGHMPHSRVREYYELTIDPDIEIYDSVDHSTWFAGPSTDYGYRFSRIGVASTPGGSEADRKNHFADYDQRTNLVSPPINPNDVGVDPPSRFYNGDFFNSKIDSGLLAGYSTAPQIGGPAGDAAALLNNSGKTFTHLPVLFPNNTTSFAFDTNVTVTSSSDSLVVTFERDDHQTYSVTDTNILKTAGNGQVSIDATNFPSFSQLMGRMVKVSVALNSGSPTSTTLTVDNLRLATTNPLSASVSIDDGLPQRSRVRSLTVTFSGVVSSPIPIDAFSLSQPNGSIVLNMDTSSSTPEQTIAVFTFAGDGTEFGSLKDGNYTFTVNGQRISDNYGQFIDGDGNGIPGGQLVLTFHRLFGDSDGNRTVNSDDFAALRMVFGLGASVFDFDNNSVTGSDDFAAFRRKFGITLVP